MPLVVCPDCGRHVSDEAPACVGCGRPSRRWAFLHAQTIRTPEVESFVYMTTVVASAYVDEWRGLWTDGDIATARVALNRDFPGLDVETVACRFGRDAAQRIVAEAIQSRRSQLEAERKQRTANVLLAVGSPCHLCGSSEEIAYVDFGLAGDEKTSRNWLPTIVSVAASSAAAVAAIALGAGRFPVRLSGPSKKTAREIVHMRLALCGRCAAARTNYSRRPFPTLEDYAQHPLWNQVRAAGYTTLLEAEALTRYTPA